MKDYLTVGRRSLIAGLLAGFASTLPALAADLNVPAQYTNIQAAVNAAASGDTIHVAPGVYVEQVTITNKNLTLAGAPGAVIRAYAGMTQTFQGLGTNFWNHWSPLLGIAFAEVNVRDLAFEGEHLANVAPALHQFAGIYFYGASGRVERCSVRGFTPMTMADTLAYARGVLAINPVSLGTSVATLQVLNSSFADDLVSIHIVGEDATANLLRTVFAIDDNLISGVGPTMVGNQIGIEIGTGASGEVRRNTISDHLHIGANLTEASFGILAYDRARFSAGTPLRALQPVLYESNTFRNNDQHLASLLGHGSQFVNNTFQGSGTASRPFAIGLSGNTNLVSGNRFSDVPLGILLFGNDPDFGTYLGLAANPTLIGNRFCDVTTPINIEPLVTGTTNQGTLICPFPPPPLAIAPAVLLTWPAVDTGYTVECATNAAGPWFPVAATPTITGNEIAVTVKATDAAKFFRLQSP